MVWKKRLAGLLSRSAGEASRQRFASPQLQRDHYRCKGECFWEAGGILARR